MDSLRIVVWWILSILLINFDFRFGFRDFGRHDEDGERRGINVIVAHYIGAGNLVGNVSKGTSLYIVWLFIDVIEQICL